MIARLLFIVITTLLAPLASAADLAGFWQSGYEEVKREMKGRYPKHPWPDNPLEAVATARTRHRRDAS